jgi:hypothetical protein
MTAMADYEIAIKRWAKKHGGVVADSWSNPGYSKEYALEHHDVLLPEPDFGDYAESNIFRSDKAFMFNPDKHAYIWGSDRVNELALHRDQHFITYAEDFVENKLNNLIQASGQSVLVPIRWWYYWAMEGEHVKVLTVAGCVIVAKPEMRPIDTDHIVSELLKED